MRPSFKDGYRDEVQVVIIVLSVDMAHQYDIPGMNAASLATMLSGIPFEGPVGSVRMGLIGGEWVINPTFQDLEESTFDIVVAGRRNDAGQVDILMIEGEAPENTWALLQADGTMPTEQVVAEGLEAAKRAIDELIEMQLEFVAMADVKPKPFEPKPLYGADTWAAAETFEERLETAIVPDRYRARGRDVRDQGPPEGRTCSRPGARRPTPRASPRSRRHGRTCRRRSCGHA